LSVYSKHVTTTAMSEAAGDDQTWTMMWSTDRARATNSTTSTPVDLEMLFGPRRFELYKVVPITVVYVLYIRQRFLIGEK